MIPWEVVGHPIDRDGAAWTPPIGFVWTESDDKGLAFDLACIYYGRSKVHDVWHSRYGKSTPSTGYIVPE